MELGFGGDVADYYQRFRRGYPAPVIDRLAEALGLGGDDLAVDIGCGTGQLTLPLAARVRAVIGVDPEPDMLRLARRAAGDRDLANISWMLGTDADIPALTALLGRRSIGAVTIAQALHWMDHPELFGRLASLVRPGGGVAVITNGIPLWLQDSRWSSRLRAFLQDWLGTPVTNTCGTDEASRRTYLDSLTAAGFVGGEQRYDYIAGLDLKQLIGGVLSALPLDRLPPPAERAAFAEGIRLAVAPDEHFTEYIPVSMVIGRAPAGGG